MEKIHSASLSSMPFSANRFLVSSSIFAVTPPVTKEVSGILWSASISSTLLNAAIATSIISSSGSRVVIIFCKSIPGALNIATNLLSNLAKNFKISYETPAISGNNTSSMPRFMKNFATELSTVNTYWWKAQVTSEIITIFTNKTMKRNEVPHLSCMREHSLTFAGVSSTPRSYAFIVLCSAP